MVNASVDFSQSNNYYIKKEDVKVEENEKEEEEDTNCVDNDSYNCNGNYQQQQQYIMQRYVNTNNNVKKGWICNKCNHFNYDSRKQCMKCYMAHDGKNIKHNSKKHIHEENYKTNTHHNKMTIDDINITKANDDVDDDEDDNAESKCYEDCKLTPTNDKSDK
jgi:hypothetical protein